MDYLVYILGVLVMGLICSIAIRLRFRNRTQRRSNKRAVERGRVVSAVTRTPAQHVDQAAEAGLEQAIKDYKPALERALMHVRTPWGWPGHELRNGTAESRRSLSSRLFRQKGLVGNTSENPRTSNSIRALLEDRYGRVNRQSMSEVRYQKVKAPRLRDPSEPHDQMDNFGVKQAERIRHKLKLLKAMDAAPAKLETKEIRYVELKDIKRPWGW